MGAYYHLVNPAKRQFFDMAAKASTPLSWVYAEALGLLLWDERRRAEWPFALIGSWAGDTVYLACDDEPATIVRSETEYVLPYCLDTRTPTNSERNLWSMALEEFEEVSADALALVYEFRPAVFEDFAHRATAGPSFPDSLPASLRRGRQRVRETVIQLGARRAAEGPAGRVPACYPPDERFLLVQPSTRQYLSAARLGERGDLRHLLGGWHACVFGWGLLWGDWIDPVTRLGPVYAAGEFTRGFPPGVPPPPGTPCRNLYEHALAEYAEMSYHFLSYESALVDAAYDNPALFVALGSAVFEEDLPSLNAELTRQLGTDWLDRYTAVLGGDETAAPKRPPREPLPPPAPAISAQEIPPAAPAPVGAERPVALGLPLRWRGSVVGYLKDPQVDALERFRGKWVSAETPAAEAFLLELQSGSPVEVRFDDAGIAWWQDQLPGRCQEDYDANRWSYPGLLLVASLREGVLRIMEVNDWALRGLTQVLRDARSLLARPDNDFGWSTWKDADAALRELDALITLVAAGNLPRKADLAVLFAPTGPVQEVAVSGGWGHEFLPLAARFDAAAKRVYPA